MYVNNMIRTTDTCESSSGLPYGVWTGQNKLMTHLSWPQGASSSISLPKIRYLYANVSSIPVLIYYYKTMVDVDMADAGSSTLAKGKLVGPAKGKSPEGGGLDGKKRFEVKKVGSRSSAMEGRD